MKVQNVTVQAPSSQNSQEEIYQIEKARFEAQKKIRFENNIKPVLGAINIYDGIVTFLSNQNFFVRFFLIVFSGLVFAILIDSVFPQSNRGVLNGEISLAKVFMTIYVPIILIGVHYKLWTTPEKNEEFQNSVAVSFQIEKCEDNLIYRAESEGEKNKLESLGFSNFDIVEFLIESGGLSESRYALFYEGGFFTPVNNFKTGNNKIYCFSLSDLMKRFNTAKVTTYEKAPNNSSQELFIRRIENSFNTSCEECMSYDYCYWVHYGQKYSFFSRGDYLKIA